MKQFRVIMITVALLAILVSPVLAEDKAEDAKEMSGKDLFKANCKVCHGEDADAGEYTPMTYIIDQWDEFFNDLWVETHGEVACPQDTAKKVTDNIDKDMLKKIHTFCVDHAADSEQPMTCG